jgi:hypothetical protein
MSRRPVTFVALVLALTGLLAGCAEHKEAKHKIEEPMTVEEIEGTDLKRITLTESAFDRLAIRTVKIRDAGNRTKVVGDAVLIDTEGRSWVYVSPQPLSFQRQEVTLDRYVGDQALLKDGPPAGTEVVLEGAMELYGAEFGIK